MAEQYPLWTQDQAIAYEAAREAINDVIAGYSAQIDAARRNGDEARVTWLNMRIDQAWDVAHSLNVRDSVTVTQVLQEFSAVVRARNAGGLPLAA